MENVATSVRIAGDAIRILSDLSSKLGQSKAQVIEMALRELEEHLFWAEVDAAFIRTAADPEEAAKQREEMELWDRISDHDFRELGEPC